MKALSAESPRPRAVRRVSKPVMEKRRRERINHSLETLRLLMLENTDNESLKNPKVEKAEILESVVHFLRTRTEVEKGRRAAKRVLTTEQRPTSARQHSYHEGMRSCLLRVSHFIASKTQELQESCGEASLVRPQSNPPSPGHIYRELIPSTAALSPQHLLHHNHQLEMSHPYLTQVTGLCDTREPFSSMAASRHIIDPVWRPWPQ